MTIFANPGLVSCDSLVPDLQILLDLQEGLPVLFVGSLRILCHKPILFHIHDREKEQIVDRSLWSGISALLTKFRKKVLP